MANSQIFDFTQIEPQVTEIAQEATTSVLEVRFNDGLPTLSCNNVQGKSFRAEKSSDWQNRVTEHAMNNLKSLNPVRKKVT